MTVNSVRGHDDLYYVDTGMLGHDERMAAYVIDGAEPTVVDPGLSTAADRLLGGLDELSLDPEDVEHVVLTHIHLDHAGAAGFLADRCPAATVHCHEIGAHFLSDEAKLSKLLASVRRNAGTLADDYGTARPIPEERFDPLRGGERVDLGDRGFEVLRTAGHAPHHVCLYGTDDGVLFTGDECGEYIAGTMLPTTPPPNFDLGENLASLDRLAEYDAETLLYAHYGPRYGAEGAFAEYAGVLREWVGRVEERWRACLDDREVARSIAESGDAPHFDRWDGEVAVERARIDVKGVLQYVKDR